MGKGRWHPYVDGRILLNDVIDTLPRDAVRSGDGLWAELWKDGELKNVWTLLGQDDGKIRARGADGRRVR